MRSTFVLAVTLLFTNSLLAQTITNPVHDHNVTAETMIDGAEHPELIPDSDAYRLYFIAVSESANPSDQQKARQAAHLRKVGLRGSDLQNAVATFGDFKQQYADLIARYNEAATAALAKGERPDVATFLGQRDALVQSTREQLKTGLTPEGLKHLDTIVQSEKHFMKVAPREGK